MSKYKDMSTDDLILAYRNGDEHAFTTLYLRYKNLVFYTLKRKLRNNQDIADDISQTVWLSVAKGLREDYRFECKFTTYLHTVIHTRFLNYLRSKWADDTMTTRESDIADMMLYGIGFSEDGAGIVDTANETVRSGAEPFCTIDVETGVAIYDKVYAEVVGKLNKRDQEVFNNHIENGGKGHQDTADRLGYSIHYIKKQSQKIFNKTNDEIKRRFYEELRNYNQDH